MSKAQRPKRALPRAEAEPRSAADAPAAPPPDPSGVSPDLEPNVRGPLRLGLAAVAVLVIGLGGWASTATLASAARAPGVVKPVGEKRAVQHLEGGIVKELHVSEGDSVVEGQPLIELSDVRSLSDYKTRYGARLALEALEAALMSELDGEMEIRFPADLLEIASRDADIAGIVDDQRLRFEARRRAFDDQLAVLDRRIAQTRSEIDGLEAVIASSERQLRLNQEETAGVVELYNKGLARRPRVLELQGQAAELEGRIERTRAEIAQAEQRIGETELRVIELKSARRDESTAELASVRARLLEARNAEVASQDVLDRTVVVAPVSGVVVGMTQHTIGGVVSPGSVVLEIIPDEDELVVEARVSPLDIDTVRVGQEARVTFTSFKQDEAEPVEGEVQLVGAASEQDDRTGETYFSVRVSVPESALQEAAGDIVLTTGMPAEVTIIRGQRTALAYLVEPFTNALSNAFLEE